MSVANNLKQKMVSPKQFEMVVKMGCQCPSICSKDRNNPLPSTSYSDDYTDLENAFMGQRDELNFADHVKTLITYKDPLNPPDEQSFNRNSSGSKPGRNMRACKSVTAHCKDIPDMMSKRKHLLKKQGKEKLQFEKEESSVQMATALVNGLLHNGFQLEAPDETPREDYMNPLAPTFSTVKPIEETMLIADVYREVRRVGESES